MKIVTLFINSLGGDDGAGNENIRGDTVEGGDDYEDSDDDGEDDDSLVSDDGTIMRIVMMVMVFINSIVRDDKSTER